MPLSYLNYQFLEAFQLSGFNYQTFSRRFRKTEENFHHFITKADKNNSVVILDKIDYERKLKINSQMRQLTKN